MNTPPHKPFSAGHAEQYDRKATEAEWLDPEIVFGLAYPFVAPGDSILDIGIGTGLSSALFSRAGLKVYGMDASKDMLDVCRKKNMAERLEVHDLRTPPYPFENTSINHAVCTGVMHLFASLDVIFAETARIMKKNGVFAFVVFHCEEQEERIRVMPPRHDHPNAITIHRHPRSEMEEIYTTHGFEPLRTLLFTAASIGRQPDEFRACVVRKK